MEGDSDFRASSKIGSPLPPYIGDPILENSGFWWNNQLRNQSSASCNFNNGQSVNLRSLHLEDQLQRLRIDSAATGQHVSPTNQRTGNPTWENNGFWWNNQPRNQSFTTYSFDHGQSSSDPSSSHSLDNQLQRLRIDNAATGQRVSHTNQRTGNPMLENNDFLRNNQPRNQSFANHSFDYGQSSRDPRSLHSLEDQLQRLRFDAAARGQYVNPANQQIPQWPINYYDYGSTGMGSVHDSYGRRMFMGQRHGRINSMEDLRGRVVSACKDEYECKFLMRKLNQGNPRDVAFILSEIVDHLYDLMMDECGNRVVQKLFEAVNVDQMTSIVNMIIGNERKFRDVCINHYGTRAIQKLADNLKSREQLVDFTIALRRITVTLAKTLDGGYVIQHFVQISPSATSRHILDEIAHNCIEIATDKNGCCVIQKCFFDATGQPMMSLVEAIITHALALAQDKYGNYVVQFLIKLKIAPANAAIVLQLRGRYVELSMNKFASNVVDDLIEFSDGHVHIIIHEIMDSPSFLHILQNPFGNYVVQKALRHSTGHLQNALARRILLYDIYLRSDPYGKRVLASARGYMNPAQILR